MTNLRLRWALAITTVYCLPCVAAAQTPVSATKATVDKPQIGIAIFYSDAMQGKRLASGEKYNKDALTAAHRTLPFGTMVRVTNLKNNKTVVVTINDRGPHGSTARIIDLSGRAAQELDMIK